MNVLQCLLALSALASLFVSGPNMAPIQSEATSPPAAGGDNGDYKITKDYKDSIQKDVNSKSYNANQHLGQDNLCYKDDDCLQANEGQQITGKDNAASGFNDQSKNIQQPAVSTTPLTPGIPSNGTTPTPTPTPTTSVLTVAKDVQCNFTSTTVTCPTADEFNITATTGNGSSYTFSGSESGTPLTINPPFPVIYNVTETNAPQGFVVGTPIPVGDGPFGIAFNSINGNLYVGNLDDDTVSVIDGATNTVVGTPIPVGDGPRSIAFNEDNGFLYVANAFDDTVTVINGATNTVVGTPIPVGDSPFGIAFNEDNGFMYVANGLSNNVSVIAPLTTTFSEGCNGTIASAGQTAECTITNAYGRPV
jgi:YVTN family beta-propeller protein